MKKTAIMMAATMALVAFAPIATAADGNLSRTFLTLGSVDWEPHSVDSSDGIGGAGWYHPDDRDGLCLLRLFGFGISVGFYYESARATVNSASSTPVTGNEEGVFVDCPPPFADATTPNPQFIGTSDFSVNLGSQVSQSHLLCTKTFSLCNPDTDSAKWLLYDCNGYTSVEFGEGDLIEAGLGVGIGSSQVTDGCELGVDAGVAGHDASSYLDPQLNNQASLVDVRIEDIVGNGDGTTYVMSCFSIDYTAFPAGTSHVGITHDYFLVLDEADAPATWAAALVNHAMEPTGTPGPKYAATHDSVALQGFYDLSGQNGCQSDTNTAVPAI